MMRKEEDEIDLMLINEEKVIPKLGPETDKKVVESNLWYLDNGASNHMSGQRDKFNELDESIAGKVNFGDKSVVYIKGKGSITLPCNNGETRTLRRSIIFRRYTATS